MLGTCICAASRGKTGTFVTDSVAGVIIEAIGISLSNNQRCLRIKVLQTVGGRTKQLPPNRTTKDTSTTPTPSPA